MDLEALRFPAMRQPDDKFDIHLITEPSRARMAFEALRKEKVVLVDTETFGLNPRLHKVRLFQIGNPRHMFVVDVRTVDPRIFSSILEDPEVLKILQNAVFDYKMLRHQYGMTINNIYDTKQAELTLISGLHADPKEALKASSLGAMAKKYLGIDLEKTIRMDFTKLPEDINWDTRPDLIKYAGLDVYYPAYIYRLQRQNLIEKALVNAAKFEFDMIEAMTDLELAGVYIDTAKWKNIIQSVEELYYNSDHDLTRIFNKQTKQQPLWDDAPTVNVDSCVQMLKYLQQMGYPVDSTAHEALIEYYDDPLIAKVLQHRKYSKLLSSFGTEMLAKVEKGSRLYADFNQMGASASGRMSSSSPNLQQVPADQIVRKNGEILRIRDCFIPAPGYKFVLGDFSQQEVRIAAYLFKEPILQEVYANNQDVYRYTGALMFNKKYEAIDKKSHYRQIAKTIVLSSNYGGGAANLRLQLLEAGIRVEESEAEKYLKLYQEAYPDLMSNMAKHVKKVMQQGFVEYAYGKKRFFHTLLAAMQKEKPNTEEYRVLKGKIARRAKNTPVQGNAAVMTKLAHRGIHTTIKNRGLDAKVVLLVHDEIVCEAKEDVAAEVREIMRMNMDSAFQEICPEFPNQTAVSILDKWEKD